MAGTKNTTSFDLQEDAVRMLNAAAEKYGLKDAGKALRCLIDYAAIFALWRQARLDLRPLSTRGLCLTACGCGGRQPLRGWVRRKHCPENNPISISA